MTLVIPRFPDSPTLVIKRIVILVIKRIVIPRFPNSLFPNSPDSAYFAYVPICISTLSIRLSKGKLSKGNIDQISE